MSRLTDTLIVSGPARASDSTRSPDDTGTTATVQSLVSNSKLSPELERSLEESPAYMRASRNLWTSSFKSLITIESRWLQFEFGRFSPSRISNLTAVCLPINTAGQSIRTRYLSSLLRYDQTVPRRVGMYTSRKCIGSLRVNSVQYHVHQLSGTHLVFHAPRVMMVDLGPRTTTDYR